MKKIINYLPVIFIFLVISSCKKESTTVQPAPVVDNTPPYVKPQNIYVNKWLLVSEDVLAQTDPLDGDSTTRHFIYNMISQEKYLKLGNDNRFDYDNGKIKGRWHITKNFLTGSWNYSEYCNIITLVFDHSMDPDGIEFIRYDYNYYSSCDSIRLGVKEANGYMLTLFSPKTDGLTGCHGATGFLKQINYFEAKP